MCRVEVLCEHMLMGFCSVQHRTVTSSTLSSALALGGLECFTNTRSDFPREHQSAIFLTACLHIMHDPQLQAGTVKPLHTTQAGIDSLLFAIA